MYVCIVKIYESHFQSPKKKSYVFASGPSIKQHHWAAHTQPVFHLRANKGYLSRQWFTLSQLLVVLTELQLCEAAVLAQH